MQTRATCRSPAASPSLPFLLAYSLVSTAATITVDQTGGGSFFHIQSALDAAADGDTVLVKPGVYTITEPLDFNRLGGDTVKNLTLRSEAGPDVSVIRMSDTPADPDRASVVVFQSGEGPASLVSGFTVRGGTRLGGYHRSGGGIHVRGSSPRIEACTIRGNRAVNGGGVSCTGEAAPTFVNCVIQENGATFGGGLFCVESPATFGSCTIRGNGAADTGGGVYTYRSELTLDQCEISENAGTGVYCSFTPSPTLTRCTIARNWESGVYCDGSSPRLTFCTLTANRASHLGGGLLVRNAGMPILVGCHFTGNMATVGGGACIVDPAFVPEGGPLFLNTVFAGNQAVSGGGVYSSASFPELVNCTFNGNRAGDHGAVAAAVDTPTLTNCILWDNVPESAAAWIPHCIVGHDPAFVRPGQYDFERFVSVEIRGSTYEFPDVILHEPDLRLRESSIAIDAGTDEYTLSTDANGNGRPCGAAVDVGAYEYGGCSAQRFKRGDTNGDDTANLADAVAVLEYVFLDGRQLACADAADVNDDSSINVADAVALLSYLFLGAEHAPRIAIGACAIDSTPDALAACSYATCPEEPIPRYVRGRGGLIVFVLERSMRPTAGGTPTYMLVNRAVIEAVQLLGPRHRVSIIDMVTYGHENLFGDPPIAMDGEGKERLSAYISRGTVDSNPDTCLCAAVLRGLQLAQRYANPDASLVLIGSGRATCSGDEVDPQRIFSKITTSNGERFPINTVYTGSHRGDDWYIGKPLMERLARATNGWFRLAGEPWGPPW